MPAAPALPPAPDAPPDVALLPAEPAEPDVPPTLFAAPLVPRVPLAPALATLPPLALAPPFALAPAEPPALLFAPDDEVPLDPHADWTSTMVNAHAVEASLGIAIDPSWRGVGLAITILSRQGAPTRPVFRLKIEVSCNDTRKILILCAR
jgi:hypothetical protein